MTQYETSNNASLSGYLFKFCENERLHLHRKLWLNFDPIKQKLSYYENPGDLVALGQIDIKSASFTFLIRGDNYLIKISSKNEDLLIGSSDREYIINWLSSLQRLRKHFIVTPDSDIEKCNIVHPNVILEKEKVVNSSVFYDNLDNSLDNHVYPQSKSSEPHSLKQQLARLQRFAPNMLQRIANRSINEECQQCRQYITQIAILTDDKNACESEVQTNRELIKILKSQLESTITEKDSFKAICKSEGSVPEQVMNVLTNQHEELNKLRLKLRQSDTKIEELEGMNQSLKKEKSSLKEQLALMEELIIVKDQTVRSLTNEIFELERSPTNQENSASDEIEKLADSVKAYQIQNECLNQEIIELNEIRNAMEKKQQELQFNCCEWEAKCCQIQSKLLSLLKELNQAIEVNEKDGDSHSDLISKNTSVKALVLRLLDESSLDIPLSWKPGNKKRNVPFNVVNDGTDELGFYCKNPEEMKLDHSISIKGGDIESADPEYQQYYANWKTRWDDFINDLSENGVQKSSDLKMLLRSGVPQEYRCKIWRYLINLRIRSLKNRYGADYYNRCCLELAKESKLNPAVKQIELDLLRTLPNNKHFESIHSVGISRLRRVLTCYSAHNPSVGYCQGMNRLAAVALLLMTEEDAFWVLVAIVENIMPADYFTPTLLGAHVDQYVLRDLFAEKLPELSSHLEEHKVELSLFSWFLTCFVDNIPTRIYLRIWDVFLYEGDKVLFRFALAFLKYHKDTILGMNDAFSINNCLRTLGEKTIDARKLCFIAFKVLNPFPMSKVRTKRAHYSEIISTEFKRLAGLRKAFPVDEKIDDSLSD